LSHNEAIAPTPIQARKSWGLGILFFIIVALLAVYFRCYWHWGAWLKVGDPVEARARVFVTQALERQVKHTLDKQLPQMSEEERWDLARKQVSHIVTNDPDQFQTALDQASASLRKGLDENRKPYLLAADSYYYYFLTKRLSEGKGLGDERSGGRNYNPNRRYPHGSWDWDTAYPRVGYLFYQVMRLARPGIPLMEALCYFPLFIVLLSILAFGAVILALRWNVAAFLGGALVLSLAPIFIQRSAFGWYDTDPFNYLFPLMLLACTFWITQKPRLALRWGMLAGVLTGIYALFWAGWPVFVGLIAAGTFCSAIVFRCFRRDEKNPFAPFLVGYAIFSFIGACVFLTPALFLETIVGGLSALPKFAKANLDLWPNIFLTVGETRPISVLKLIFLTGNYATVGVCVLGLFWFSIEALVRRGKLLYQWLILGAFALPLFVLALKTERFALLVVIPLAILFAFVMDRVYRLLLTVGSRVRVLADKPIILSTVCVLLVLALALPSPIVSASLISPTLRPIMNRAWHDALIEIRDKTPQNAVVHSWWPPGYFLISIAERKVSSDGGSQHFPELYWVARAFLAQNENEALGLFRMVNTGGNKGLEYLRTLGWSDIESVDLINEIVKYSRADADRLLKDRLESAKRGMLLDQTHGIGEYDPTYLFLYNDMIEQNLSMTIFSNWDFKKAESLAKERVKTSLHERANRFVSLNQRLKKLQLYLTAGVTGATAIEMGGFKASHQGRLIDGLQSHWSDWLHPLNLVVKCKLIKIKQLWAGRELQPSALAKYVNEVVASTRGILKYTPESPLTEQNDNVLKFANGLQVNLESMQSVLISQELGIRGVPHSLMYAKAGKFEEKVNALASIDVSAILINREGQYSAVLASPELARSVLFRLYYLGGEGYKAFNPIIETQDAATKTRVLVVELNWKAYENV